MTENEAIAKITDFGLYHAIKDLPHSTRTVEAFEKAISALDEIKLYHALGTVEECSEAMEKQMAKKPKEVNCDYSYYVCPVCGATIYCTDDFNSHHYCLNCGQAIDFSEEEENE